MTDAKYIGLDVHQATISAAVLDSTGRLMMESVVETKAATILQFVHGLRGSVHVTLEEGTCAAWLHDLLKPPSAAGTIHEGFQADLVIDRFPQPLLAAQVALRCLHADMPEQELDLLKFAA